MIRIIICTVGAFVFGILYGEILNKLLKVVEFRINVYLFAGLISLIFLCSQLVLGHFEKKASISEKHQSRFNKIKDCYHIFMVFLVFILLVALPFIWWGTILKVSTMANKGIR